MSGSGLRRLEMDGNGLQMRGSGWEHGLVQHCLYYVQYSPHSQETEDLVLEFLGYVRRKLGILLAFNWFIFSRWKR